MESKGSIFEIRAYHYRADSVDEYREWAHSASVALGARLDVVGFWIDTGTPGRIMGADQMKLPHGSANVT